MSGNQKAVGGATVTLLLASEWDGIMMVRRRAWSDTCNSPGDNQTVLLQRFRGM